MTKIEKLKEVKKVLENGLGYKFFIYDNSLYFYDYENEFMYQPTLDIDEYNEVAYIGIDNELYVTNNIFEELNNVSYGTTLWNRIEETIDKITALNARYTEIR